MFTRVCSGPVERRESTVVRDSTCCACCLPVAGVLTAKAFVRRAAFNQHAISTCLVVLGACSVHLPFIYFAMTDHACIHNEELGRGCCVFARRVNEGGDAFVVFLSGCPRLELRHVAVRARRGRFLVVQLPWRRSGVTLVRVCVCGASFSSCSIDFSSRQEPPASLRAHSFLFAHGCLPPYCRHDTTQSLFLY